MYVEKPVYQGAKDVSNKSSERLIFQDCYAQIGQVIPHPCKNLERQKNLTAIVKSTFSTTQYYVRKSSVKFYQRFEYK